MLRESDLYRQRALAPWADRNDSRLLLRSTAAMMVKGTGSDARGWSSMPAVGRHKPGKKTPARAGKPARRTSSKMLTAQDALMPMRTRLEKASAFVGVSASSEGWGWLSAACACHAPRSTSRSLPAANSGSCNEASREPACSSSETLEPLATHAPSPPRLDVWRGSFVDRAVNSLGSVTPAVWPNTNSRARFIVRAVNRDALRGCSSFLLGLRQRVQR